MRVKGTGKRARGTSIPKTGRKPGKGRMRRRKGLNAAKFNREVALLTEAVLSFVALPDDHVEPAKAFREFSPGHLMQMPTSYRTSSEKPNG